jgi:hypothetical protein
MISVIELTISGIRTDISPLASQIANGYFCDIITANGETRFVPAGNQAVSHL